MTRRADETRSTGPPPIRRNTGRTIIVLACAAIIAVLLIVVVFNIETEDAQPARAEGDDDVIELVEPPTELTEQEERALTGADANLNDTLPLEVPRGGWLQMQDDEGRLAQRFRFTRSEPRPAGKPAGWSSLENPEAELFISDDEAIALRGDEALAYVPHQALEEGSITGDVVIELYRTGDRRSINRSRDTPVFVVRAEQAAFDNMIGEVRCPGPVRLESPGRGEIVGADLVLRINDMVDRLELLEIAQVDYIRLITPDDGGDTAAPAAYRRRQPDRPMQRRDPAVRLASWQGAAQPAPSEAPSPEAEPPAQFYELTLGGDVVIAQGPADAGRTAHGDAVSIIFSPKTRGLDEAVAAAPLHHQPVATFHSVPTVLASMFLAQVDASPSANVPAPGVDETIITFDGPLRVLPVDDPSRRLDSPEDSRLVLSGAPVELVDEVEQARATAGRLVYSSLQRHVELVRSDAHSVNIESPKLTAGGDRFWLAQSSGRGGFVGEGWLRPVPETNDAAAAPAAGSRDELLASMSVTWSDGVELSFGATERRDALGPLERVQFSGDVRVRSDDGVISAESLDLALWQTSRGEPEPHLLIATGNVAARREGQTIWADALEVEFLHGEDAPPASTTEKGSDPVGEARVRRVVANGNVQILMADGSRVFADRLEGDGVHETLDLFGHNIVIAAGQMLIERGTEVRLHRARRTARWQGVGTAHVFDGRLDVAADRRIAPPSVGTFAADAPARTMTITWADGVDLGFAESAEDATSEADDPGALGRLEHVTFSGNVQADSEDGAIGADTLDLALIEGVDGRPQPDVMTATGHVSARNDEQTIWADTLTAQFLAATSEGAAPADDDDALAANVRVRHVTASGDVQILLADGSRAFADRLEGDGINETLDLFGENIVIAAGRLLSERGAKLTLRKDEQTAFWDSPGLVRLFDTELNTAADHRIDRPVIDEQHQPPVLRVTWDMSMIYDHGFNDGAGAVDLRGNVKAFSSQDPLEENSMESNALTLEFMEEVGSAARPASETTGVDDLGDRKLKRFVARGDAKLESRTWRTEQHAEKPRVFYAAGQHIEYDDETFEARILSDGTLLIRDEWQDQQDSADPSPRDAGSRAPTGSTFSGKGTTLFTWTRELHMEQVLENRYSIDMSGDVTVIHEGLEGDTATVTAETLSAVVTRIDAARRRGAGLDFGGAMELRRLSGHGGVLIETTARTVECASFGYNVDTAMAELKGARGRPVTIINAGAAYPLHAQEVLWNMERDTITIVRGAGSGGQ